MCPQSSESTVLPQIAPALAPNGLEPVDSFRDLLSRIFPERPLLCFPQDVYARVHVACRTKSGRFWEASFEWPSGLPRLLRWVDLNRHRGDLYFCPMLLRYRKRNARSVVFTQCVWADLDECHPKRLTLPPTASWETSTGCWQCVYALTSPVPHDVALSLSNALAYAHKEYGCDNSGGLAKLLRIPNSLNFKHDPPQRVSEVEFNGAIYEPGELALLWGTAPCHDFGNGHSNSQHIAINEPNLREGMHPVAQGRARARTGVPDLRPVFGPPNVDHLDAETLLANYDATPAMWEWFEEPPTRDRSSTLYLLAKRCLEKGMTLDETYAVLQAAACNKWPDTPGLLWKDVKRIANRLSER